MEQVTWKYLAGIFGIPDMSISDKIKEFEKSFNIVGKSTSVYSKILCYLAYRCLDGSYDKIEDVEKRIEEHLILLSRGDERDRAIWTQSLNTAKCYINIERGDIEKAKQNAKDSIDSYSNEKNPGGIVNLIRMHTILYALTLDVRHFNESEILFKESVSKFEITKESPWLIGCITKASKSLEILSILHNKLNSNYTINSDTENPYNKCIRIILKK